MGARPEVAVAWSADDTGAADPTATDRPNLARATNYLVGGGANFAADRDAVHALLAMDPAVGHRFRASRAFVGRAVRAALDRGCGQFLELGAGIPSHGGLHVQVGAAEAHVVYVDVDPVAVAHTCDLLAGQEEAPHAAALRADLRDVARVLDEAAGTDLLDVSRPVTVVCNSVLQWLADSDADDLAAVFDAYYEALAPGSQLMLAVAHSDLLDPHEVEQVSPVIEAAVGAPLRLRSRAELVRVVGRWGALAPGIVDVVDWPAPSGADPVGFYAVCAART